MRRLVQPWTLPGAVPAAVVFVVALVVRLVALQLSFGEGFFFGKYLVLGDALADGGLIADRPFSYAPIYTYFIAVGRLLFGDALYPILFVQCLIGSLSCVLILFIARRLIGPRWAWAPALLACVYRSFVLYDVTFLSDSLGLCFQLGLLLVLLRLRPEAGLLEYAPVGVLAGLSVLHRPNNLLLLLLVLGLIALRVTPRKVGLQRAALVGAIAAVVISPVVLQNLRLTGTPGITASNPGYIFYSSNNAASYGFRYSPPELYYHGSSYYEQRGFQTGGAGERFLGDAEIAAMISGAVEGRRMSLRESSGFYRSLSLEHMLRYPGHYAGLQLQKLWLAFNGFESHDVLPVFVRRDNLGLLVPVGFAAVVPFGLLGLALSWHRRDAFTWPYVLLANNLVLLLAFYVVVRFRLPLEAMSILFSGVALRSLHEWFAARSYRRLALAAAALVLIGAVCNVTPRTVSDRAHGNAMDVLLDDSRRRLAEGDDEGALRQLERLIRRDREDLPRLLQAHQLAGQIYAQTGAPTAGSAMRPRPFFEPAAWIARLEEKRAAGSITYKERRYLGYLYGQARRWSEARDVLAEALALRRPDPLMRYELARAEEAVGDKAAARDQLEIAMQDGLLLSTKGLVACYRLARIHRELGDARQAARWTEQAARQSAMTPWVPGGESLAPVIAELKTLPGYVEPLPLEALVPLAPRK